MTARSAAFAPARLAVLIVLTLAALLYAPTGSRAQGLGGGPTHIHAELVAESPTPRPGGETSIAIAMTPEARWHGYWINGGDAGFGMQVTWTLPPGVSVGELAYPVPDTLVIAGLMNHVYEHPYALIAPLQVAANLAPGTRLPIRGEAQWLACTDQICVPERGSFSLDLVVGDGNVASADRARFDGWRAALPQPLGSPAHFERAGDRLRLAIPLPASMAVTRPHLFVATQRADKPAATQQFGRSGDMLIVETDAGPDLAATSTIDALLRIGDGRGLSFAATAGPVPPMANELSGADTASDAGIGLGAAFLGALIGGLLLNIMPCVFPILSLKALTLARAGGDAREARMEGLAYMFGAVFACLALGAILLLLRAGGEAAGWAFQLQNPALVVMLTILIGAITANLAGLFDFASVGFGERWGGMSGPKGAFATGALAAFVATPCSGPFLGAALGATLVLPAPSALAVFGGLGFGLALPFLAIALIPALRTRLPRPGQWMVRLRRWLAIPMALTALALVWLLGRQVGPIGWAVGAAALALTAILAAWAGRLQRSGRPAKAPLFLMAALIVPLSLLLPQAAARNADAGAIDSVVGAERWTAERESALRAAGRPLFVYFTADWCVTCKVNEAGAIEREETARAFRDGHVAVLVADWTNADAAITRELARHQRNSVPLYLWYAPGATQPEVLPQLLTPAMLSERAARPRG